MSFSLSPGTKLGRYEIRSQLGAGGMGEVYRSRDASLNRDVAIKVLPAAFSADNQRLRRFEQEAKSAGGLNHPNIAHIYEIGESDNMTFIVMELVDGQTLRRRLNSAQLTPIEALTIAIQIADALAAAHEAGVIHRDIKPENIMIRTRDGYVKVLDFGLAKLAVSPNSQADTEAATRTLLNTGPGTVVGTTQYMSPEQARGKQVDARTDIWSLGCVLYEMVAGRAPFAGESTSDLVASILEREPAPLARYARAVPETLEWIVTKALRKDREDRYQTARELLTDLRSLKQRLEFAGEQERSVPPASSEPTILPGVEQLSAPTISENKERQTQEAAHPTSAEYLIGEMKRHKRGLVLSLTAVVLILVGVVVVLKFLRSPTKTAVSFSKMKVTRLTTTGKASYAAISPDGKYVVHVSGSSQQQSILLRHIATGSDKEIVPSNGNDFIWVTFSRDGSYVLYCRVESGAYPLYQVAILGGTPRKLTSEDADVAVTFSPDGKRLAFMRGEPQRGEASLVVANADGSGEQKLVSRKVGDFYNGVWSSPSWSPDGQLIAFAHRTPDGDGKNVNVIMASVKDGTEKQITSHNWSVVQALVWLEDGSGLFITAAEREPGSPRQIWHVSYPSGEAERITNDTNNYLGVSLTADSSALVTVLTEQTSDIWTAPNGEAGQATQLTSSRNDGGLGVVWTADGRIVYASGVRDFRDLWIMNPDGTGRVQLTANAGSNSTPSVSPDGRYIVFTSSRGGVFHIWRIDIDGSNPKRLTDGDRETNPTVSPDGKWVLYTAVESDQQKLRKVPIDGGETVQLTNYSSATPYVSPDGRFIAGGYIDETPPPRWKLAIISYEGGPPIRTFDISTLQSKYQWAADGRAVLYTLTRNGVANIWSQPIDGGLPKQVTDFKSDLIFRFDWSRDGKQLVLARGTINNDVVLISELR
jgi:eukaryotic-like serine/threonine-protein kinase